MESTYFIDRGQPVLKWTTEKHNFLLELVDKHNRKWKIIAEEMTKQFNEIYSSEQCRSRWRNNRHKLDEIDPIQKYGVKQKINEDGTIELERLIEVYSENDLKDPNFVIRANGFDPETWKLTGLEFSMWGHLNKELPKPVTLYANKIKLAPLENEFTLEEIQDSIQELMAGYKPPTFKPIRYAENGKLLEVNISDLHLNKLGFMDGVYDSSIAEQSFFYILDDVITRTSDMKFEKILFIWSHDFFNIDNLSKTTTAGTPQETTVRYADMFKQGKQMLIQGIDLLKQIAPVETVQVGANHDRLTSYTLSEVLYAWYRNDKNVTIDNDPISRKYRRFGKCLIGFSHGNQEKNRLGKIMPAEARKDWGKTLYSEVHAAHIHTEKAVEEDNGVIVRYLSTVSGTDTWHFESGYVGAVPKAQSFIWDKEYGMTDIINTPIIPSYPNLVKTL